MRQSCLPCLGVQFSGISSLAPLRVLFLPNVPRIYPLSPPLHPKINNLCSEARQLFAQKSTQGLGCCSGLGGKCSKYCFHILFSPRWSMIQIFLQIFQLYLETHWNVKQKVLFPPQLLSWCVSYRSLQGVYEHRVLMPERRPCQISLSYTQHTSGLNTPNLAFGYCEGLFGKALSA